MVAHIVLLTADADRRRAARDAEPVDSPAYRTWQGRVANVEKEIARLEAVLAQMEVA